MGVEWVTMLIVLLMLAAIAGLSLAAVAGVSKEMTINSSNTNHPALKVTQDWLYTSGIIALVYALFIIIFGIISLVVKFQRRGLPSPAIQTATKIMFGFGIVLLLAVGIFAAVASANLFQAPLTTIVAKEAYTFSIVAATVGIVSALFIIATLIEYHERHSLIEKYEKTCPTHEGVVTSLEQNVSNVLHNPQAVRSVIQEASHLLK